MAPTPYVQPVSKSTAVFKDDIFKGKVLFCTGGGSGICKGMTEAVMRHGANATIVGRKFDRLTAAAKELESLTGQVCLPVQADVRKPESIREAVRQTIEKFGRIDFVINGAAGNFLAPIDGLSENAFRTVIEIDLFGSYHTIKATLPYVRESKGAYINVSTTIQYHGTAYQAHVSAAKAGIDALNRVVAVEEGPRGVRSNVLAPGPISGTEGMERLTATDENGQLLVPHEPAPSGRMGTVEDCGSFTVFLFSEVASYASGGIFVLDGAHENIRNQMVPYPEAVLDAEGFKKKLAQAQEKIDAKAKSKL
ncbi:hypothetical protein EVG20_g3767 [Dentipellis fragilis]|uniref:2,4-dienoyl-CoA reductase [(3E)-enoyl-CoA-producing] n=1 Tax=Dentipellis fragilis TaxID=205917 RepID=A0A4Y9YZ95_9AGAM|nr:hypothetical protein EVG20_g3767 [Dentipellis fragilis]